MRVKAYVCISYGGEWEDSWERVKAVFTTEQEAKDWVAIRTEEEKMRETTNDDSDFYPTDKARLKQLQENVTGHGQDLRYCPNETFLTAKEKAQLKDIRDKHDDQVRALNERCTLANQLLEMADTYEQREAILIKYQILEA
jgi:predicted patatin/cPLA2 family phospholipase